MRTKQIMVENLYKMAEIIILEEKAEEIKEIKLYRNKKGWQLAITSVSEDVLQIKKLPRQMYKNVHLRSRKRKRETA